jgi:hypothetical protein
MEHPHEPLDAIQIWQDWYKKNRVIAQLDQPLVSKDSRENLHDTTNAVDKLPDWRSHYKELIEDAPQPTYNSMYKEKATDYFGDTIAEFADELTGEELFNCFLAAANKNLGRVKKEYDQAKELVNLLLNTKPKNKTNV